MIRAFERRALPVALAFAAAILGAAIAAYYAIDGLTLTHYDARGHLVVARRIFDSLTPGWQQVGAVWLPLPHLLNALAVQIDLFYRTGASGVLISIAAFAVATGAIAWMVLTITESACAAIAATAVFALNPNVLYLQSTPMTEPLLMATVSVAIALLMRWCIAADGGAIPRVGSGTSDFRLQTCGVAFALACLTRYEAWPVTAGALTLAALVRWRGGEPFPVAIRQTVPIACYPAAAIVAFTIFSRVVGGEWFLASGFFVPENKAVGDAMLAAAEIGWGVRQLSGDLLVAVGATGLAALAVMSTRKDRARYALPLALLAMAAIPWMAFVNGHPFRIRYMVPLLAIEAIGAGVAAGLIRRGRLVACAAILAVVAYELRPLDRTAPMVVEAQWDRPNLEARARVTACIVRADPGEKIMASMGSLGHYMQEASAAGYAIRDFLHEGNGDIWLAALDRPRPFASWILIEEKAEGGDMLAHIARERSWFLDGYARVCEGAGLALYKRL